ncbi:MAG: hypothetical protein M3367_03290 [Acidobacteriota bacterium]|nr:hypothetical protein [Acidobacteriota bacterium]
MAQDRTESQQEINARNEAARQQEAENAVVQTPEQQELNARIERERQAAQDAAQPARQGYIDSNAAMGEAANAEAENRARNTEPAQDTGEEK